VLTTPVVIVLLILVVVTTPRGIAFLLLVFLVGLVLHHLTELHNGVRLISSEVPVQDLVKQTILEAVDDIALGDVDDLGLCLEEVASVGAKTLVPKLFALSQVIAVVGALKGTLNVVDKYLLQVLLCVDGVGRESFEPR
jgi:hypothetical protein